MGERIGEALARALTAMLVAGCAVFFALGGIAFLAFAAYTALAGVVPPAAAGAIVGVIGLLIAALLVISLRGLARPQRSTAASSNSGGDGHADVDAAARLGEEVAVVIRTNRKAAAGLAFSAGLILGVSPRARRAVRGLFDRKG